MFFILKIFSISELLLNPPPTTKGTVEIADAILINSESGPLHIPSLSTEVKTISPAPNFSKLT